MRDELHWLPVKQRAEYKIVHMVYKCLHDAAPSYLKEYCHVLTEAELHHHLRSVTRGDIHKTRTNTYRSGPRSFSSSSSATWNTLPMTVRDLSLSLAQFKQLLKYHLFCLAYDIH